MSVTENDSELKKKINECYIKVLNRPADLDGSQSYFIQIKNGTLTIDQLASRLKKQKAKSVVYESFKKISSPFRILPDFIIIGEHKCGTTSLFELMMEHPCMISPTGKEPNYFNLHYENGLRWYRSHFPTIFYKIFSKITNKSKIVTGEATTHYLSGTNKIPLRIKKLLPSIKIIVILRNPVDRAYSHYSMLVNQELESLSFEDALAFEKQNSNLKEKKMNLPENFKMMNSYSCLKRGVYVDNLKHWMNIFPKEQFLILQTEEFNSKPNDVLNRVYRFLDLPQWNNKDHKKHNVGHYEKMNPDTRKLLVEYFKPHNKRLNEFLGTNFDWDW